MTTPMMDKGKRKKIDQDSSEDDDTSWVDTWFDTWRESLVSQSSQTTQNIPSSAPSRTSIANDMSPAAAPSRSGRARQPGSDGGPFPALSNTINVLAETGVHRYVPTRPSDQEVARLQQHYRRPQQDGRGPFIGDHRQWYGPEYCVAPPSRAPVPVAEPSSVLPVPAMDLGAGLTQAKLIHQQWQLQASARGHAPQQSCPMTRTTRTDAPHPMDHPMPDRRNWPASSGSQPKPMQSSHVHAAGTPPHDVALSPSANVIRPLNAIAYQQPTPGVEPPGGSIMFPQHQHSDLSWSCRYGTCSNQRQQYRLWSDLRRHQRNHEDKPFPCDQCTFSARFEGHLINHQESVHGDAVYYCSVCPKSYPRHDNLGRHIRGKHPRTKVPEKDEARIRPAAVEAGALLQQPGPAPVINLDPRLSSPSIVPAVPVSSQWTIPDVVTSNRVQPYASRTPLGTSAYLVDRGFAIDPLSTHQQRSNPRTPSRQSVCLSPLQRGSSVDGRQPDWPALPSQREPDAASYFNRPSSHRRPSGAARISHVGLPTPPLSRGSSVSRRRDRSRTGSLLSPPQTPSLQHRQVGTPLYSDIAAAALLPTPPSSEASASRRGSLSGRRYSTQAPAYRSRVTSSIFGLDPQV
ncbi:hypothetical protein LTR35_000302 [Friedmanniomyces endolithicus]|uniref:C2H2-type domain-containing protein n=1 Tax=Friedmanniomyces endolithicus TaxID=329885 RepID=A0AAN6FUM2_9PEZI|nr:hypothetical protein LTS00_011140 [Friedmanniomyces endolithicus]KAK0293696.1 hypothetical protein LTR35_000302 [Friedmanniomyces endolithicus]KAK0324210.1 hypothetical protein LTR82_004648 [Friedmanniomyces endolithicus]KAK0993002.1 hypothetical protein LTR54_011324 [Friedmanniomyces endolithicus]